MGGTTVVGAGVGLEAFPVAAVAAAGALAFFVELGDAGAVVAARVAAGAVVEGDAELAVLTSGVRAGFVGDAAVVVGVAA